MREEVIYLDAAGGPLTAILHSPANGTPANICAVLLSCGQTPNFGPQRLYLKAARAWAALGLHVLRVDVAGVGDSIAENRAIHIDNHSTGDARAAVDYVRAHIAPQQIFVVGVCAGARVATKYAAEDESIDGLISCNCPLQTVSFGAPMSEGHQQLSMSESRARNNLRRLSEAVTKLHFLRPNWWLWVFRNGSAFSREMFASISHLVLPRKETQHSFVEALSKVITKKRPALFVYGSVETIAMDEFRSQFPEQSIHVIQDGTHTFATLAAEQEVIALCGEWILHGGRASTHSSD